MINTKNKEFFDQMQLKKPRLWFKFINKNRLMYNSLCPKCKEKVLKMGGNIKPEDLCEVCGRNTAIFLTEIKQIVEKAGGAVE